MLNSVNEITMSDVKPPVQVLCQDKLIVGALLEARL